MTSEERVNIRVAIEFAMRFIALQHEALAHLSTAVNAMAEQLILSDEEWEQVEYRSTF